MEKNTKGIKAFLHDAKAVSPAIATLILIVIAAVAAAGIGILVSHSQGSSKAMLDTKTASVQGQINVVGSTTVLPVILKADPAFMADNPSYSVSAVGGGSGLGRYTAWTTTSPISDIGASSEVWKGTIETQQGIQLPVRNDAVIQLGGKDAKVWETKIRTSMVVLAYNGNAVPVGSSIDVNGSTSGPGVINYGDLQTLYSNGSVGISNVIKPFTVGSPTSVTVYFRSDSSGTQDTYMNYLGNAGGAYSQTTHIYTAPTSTATLIYTGLPSNEEIVAAIGDTTKCTKTAVCIGFVDVGFTSGTTVPTTQNGVIATTQNLTAATDANKGVGGKYDTASKSISNNGNGLARDLYLYSQGTPSGAIKAFLDYMLSSKGQDAVHAAGYFSS